MISVTVKTTLREIPTHHKIVFHSEIYNQENELLNTGDVTLYFMEAKTMKRCRNAGVLKRETFKIFFKYAIDNKPRQK